MSTNTDNRFLNFPLLMLAETIIEPERGMRLISEFAIVAYSKHTRRNWQAALAQAIYQSERGNRDTLPIEVLRVIERDDIQELAGAFDETWGGDNNSEAVMIDLIDTDQPDLDADEQAALVDWLALNDAASYFGRRIFNYGGMRESAAETQNRVECHECRHGVLVWASVPAEYFFEVRSQTANIESMRLFRMVAAVRSIVGKKRFTGTVKTMIRARMIGGKSPAVAETLAAESDSLAAELKAIESRFRFDRILTEGAVRGFFGKLGAGRRVYLTTQTTDPKTMAEWIDKKPALHAAYRKREQAARTRSKVASN